MRRLYWRPAGASWRSLTLLALLAVVALVMAESFPRKIQKDDYALKLEAARRAQAAFALLAEARLRRGHPIDPLLDPALSGLIGSQATVITTAAGSLESKQTTTNPNFAAVVVDSLVRLGLRRGDVVAVGCSGSFPALNVAVLAATETLGLEPLVITSNASSDYGANFPDFTWLDMEHALASGKAFRTRSLAASLGGIEDRGVGLTEEGQRLLLASIERNGTPLLPSASFEDAIERRMALYDARARGRSIRAYVNVGGGAISVGRRRGKLAYRAGINRPGAAKAPVESVIGRFLDRGVPVVHLVRIKELAEEHGLPAPPTAPEEPGRGRVFQESEPNRILIGGLLVMLSGAVVFVGRRARARAHLKDEPPLA